MVVDVGEVRSPLDHGGGIGVDLKCLGSKSKPKGGRRAMTKTMITPVTRLMRALF